MMKLTIDDKTFMREMNNIVDYSEGFLIGAKAAKPKMLKNLGIAVKELIEQYIDASARMDPSSLHHVYEWYETGSSDARLFDIQYTVATGGLTINYTFSQSKSIKEGSKTPFYDKARIMENGVAVTIRPKQASTLAFSVDGKDVFTKKAITVNDPGGRSVQGSFERTFEGFFKQYLSQSLLDISGLSKDIKNPVTFKTNLRAGKKGGKAVGLKVGADWIARAGAGV